MLRSWVGALLRRDLFLYSKPTLGIYILLQHCDRFISSLALEGFNVIMNDQKIMI